MRFPTTKEEIRDRAQARLLALQAANAPWNQWWAAGWALREATERLSPGSTRFGGRKYKYGKLICV
jgi:hypothetical protein